MIYIIIPLFILAAFLVIWFNPLYVRIRKASRESSKRRIFNISKKELQEFDELELSIILEPLISEQIKIIEGIEKGIKRKRDYWKKIHPSHKFVSGLNKSLEYIKYKKQQLNKT